MVPKTQTLLRSGDERIAIAADCGGTNQGYSNLPSATLIRLIFTLLSRGSKFFTYPSLLLRLILLIRSFSFIYLFIFPFYGIHIHIGNACNTRWIFSLSVSLSRNCKKRKLFSLNKSTNFKILSVD